MPLFNPPTLFYDPLLIQTGSADLTNVTALNFIDSRIVLSQSGPYVVDISLNVSGTFVSFAAGNNDTLTSTTNLSYQTHHAITASNAPAGTYAVSWHTECFTSQTNKTVMLDVVDESGNVMSVFQNTFSQANQAIPFSGMREVVLGATTTKTYEIRYKVVTPTTVSVVSSSLAFWKIA